MIYLLNRNVNTITNIFLEIEPVHVIFHSPEQALFHQVMLQKGLELWPTCDYKEKQQNMEYSTWS